ncbi:MAG TPA: ATP synthase F1 subunit delta [Bdellovibrionota bacterium]|jgi:F-type H+-transporting ATPase subunit delta
MATVGSVYAKAVFELAGEKSELAEVSKQLRTFLEACQAHRTLAAALMGPTVEARARKAIVDSVAAPLGVNGIALRLLSMLAMRGRLGQLKDILDQLEAMIEASQGILAGRVRSAVELSSDEIDVLGSALAKRIGGRVRLTQEVDPALLGGVVATVAGRTFDASLRTQIERFKNELI